VSEESKAMVRRMVEGINSGEIEPTVDELFAPRAARRVKGCSPSSTPPSPTGEWRSWSWRLKGTQWRVASAARVRTWASSWASPQRVSEWT